MSLLRRYRLWRYGPRVNEWTATKHTHRKGFMCMWRCTPLGDIEYRDLLPEEETAMVSMDVLQELERIRQNVVSRV